MPTGKDRSRSPAITAESVVERLERILEHGGKDAGAIVAQPAERRKLPAHRRAMLAEHLRDHDIPNLLDEVLEEDNYDKKLTDVCFAFGLLWGALHSPPNK